MKELEDLEFEIFVLKQILNETKEQDEAEKIKNEIEKLKKNMI